MDIVTKVHSLQFAVIWRPVDSLPFCLCLQETSRSLKHRFLLQDHSLHLLEAAIILCPLSFSLGLMAVIVTHLHFRCCCRAVILLWCCTSKSPALHLGPQRALVQHPHQAMQSCLLFKLSVLISGTNGKSEHPILPLFACKCEKPAEEGWRIPELEVVKGGSPMRSSQKHRPRQGRGGEVPKKSSCFIINHICK